ncbi:MAG: hypothetical protein WBH50_13180, partial [Fuerstiella sp.]
VGRISGRRWTAEFAAAFACTCGSSGVYHALASGSYNDWASIDIWRELTKPVASGPVCQVVWQGNRRNPGPYPDFCGVRDGLAATYQSKKCSMTLIAVIALKINPDSVPNNTAGHIFRSSCT